MTPTEASKAEKCTIALTVITGATSTRADEGSPSAKASSVEADLQSDAHSEEHGTLICQTERSAIGAFFDRKSTPSRPDPSPPASLLNTPSLVVLIANNLNAHKWL